MKQDQEQGKTTARQHARNAACARTNLTIFHAVIEMLEGGTLTAEADHDAHRIIGICKAAAQKQLRLMDRELRAISNG